jgi:2-octaprenylphenol hydroxylase
VRYDLIVAGGGPVGASLAHAARRLRVALVLPERRTARPPGGDAFDPRVYALSPGNIAFLREIGIWEAMPPERLAPVHAMRVFGDDGTSCVEFDAYRAGVAELAWIAEDGVLQDALWQRLDAEVLVGGIQAFDAQAGKLTLADGRVVETSLLVGADGANSVVRRLAGIETKESGYGQSAVVAIFKCGRPQAGVAWQWFLGGPVLALLPLPRGQVSMVWSLPEAEAARVVSLSPELLCREIERATRGALGTLEPAAAPKSYPLRRLASRRLVAPRVALAGDAAHVVHPLAGQGLNLGLQDARALARVLAAREPVRDTGDLVLLRRYERSRAEPILAMDAMVDGLFRLFGAPGSLAARLRNNGLNLVDRVPVLKNILARQAMH